MSIEKELEQELACQKFVDLIEFTSPSDREKYIRVYNQVRKILDTSNKD